jgi:hypothetical protein
VFKLQGKDASKSAGNLFQFMCLTHRRLSEPRYALSWELKARHYIHKTCLPPPIPFLMPVHSASQSITQFCNIHLNNVIVYACALLVISSIEVLNQNVIYAVLWHATYQLDCVALYSRRLQSQSLLPSETATPYLYLGSPVLYAPHISSLYSVALKY